MTHYNKQSGVALITVMLIFSLAAVIAVAVFTRQQVDIQRTGNMLGQAQAYEYARGAETLASEVLVTDALASSVDHKGERWAKLREGVPVKQGALAFALEDVQGRFNLNTLFNNNATQKARFSQLLALLGLPRELAEVIMQRVGTKESPALLQRVSQLREIEGVTPEIYEALLPYVAALPETESMLNVNTAPMLVLKAYFPKPEDYERMRASLAKQGYLIRGELNGIGMNTKGTAVRSDYFLLRAEANIDGRRAALASLLRRSVDDNGRVHIGLVARDRSGKAG